jgi:hypothetical protein
MKRLADWQTRLENFLSSHRSDRFRYGTWDCCLFACDAIETMTGTDVAAHFRGRYHSRQEAVEALREYTGKPSVRAVTEKITAENDMQQVPVLAAQRGDVVLIARGKRDYSLGIVALDGQHAIVVTPTGLERIELSLAVSAWRV